MNILNKKLEKYYNELMETSNLSLLFNENHYLYSNYISCYKYKNICVKLLEIIDDSNDLLFCSQTKIYSDILNSRQNEYKYLFEIIFEIVSGIRITHEQFERYQQIINNFIEWNNLMFSKSDMEYNTPLINTNKIDNLVDVSYLNMKGGSCKEQIFVNTFENKVRSPFLNRCQK
jgi:hypothetical protein